MLIITVIFNFFHIWFTETVFANGIGPLRKYFLRSFFLKENRQLCC